MTTPLEYAPKPPAHQRRVFRQITLVTCLLVFIGSGCLWVPPAWRRVELLYWQQKCMAYVPPGVQVVQTEDDADRPYISDRMLHVSNPAVVPQEWSKFYALLSPPGVRSSGTLLLHSMSRPDGAVRLVVVDLNVVEWGTDLATVRIITPGSLWQAPIERQSHNIGDFLNVGVSFQAMAGIVDSADPSHFTFQITSDGKPHLFDGWLQNDDTVVIGEHTARLTRP